jgi:hypothetical protein
VSDEPDFGVLRMPAQNPDSRPLDWEGEAPASPNGVSGKLSTAGGAGAPPSQGLSFLALSCISPIFLILAYKHFIPQQAIGHRSPIDALTHGRFNTLNSSLHQSIIRRNATRALVPMMLTAQGVVDSIGKYHSGGLEDFP